MKVCKVYVSKRFAGFLTQKEACGWLDIKENVYAATNGKVKYAAFLPISEKPIDQEGKATSSAIGVVLFENGKRGISLYYVYQNGDSGVPSAPHSVALFSIDKHNKHILPPRYKNCVRVNS